MVRTSKMINIEVLLKMSRHYNESVDKNLKMHQLGTINEHCQVVLIYQQIGYDDSNRFAKLLFSLIVVFLVRVRCFIDPI